MTKTALATSPATPDLSAIDTVDACNRPIEIEIVHPVTRAGLGIFWSLVGKDGDVYRTRIHELANENIRRANANLPSLDNTLSKLEAKNIATLVAVTTGWRTHDKPGVVVLKGEELAFTLENVTRVLTELPAVREQVQEQVNNVGNWLPG